MLKIELNQEVIIKGEELGLVVDAGVYTDEIEANNNGFYWFDEVDRWIDIDGMNEEFAV